MLLQGSPEAPRRSAIAELHLRSRPCRTRRRGTASIPPIPVKRPRTNAGCMHPLNPPRQPLGFQIHPGCLNSLVAAAGTATAAASTAPPASTEQDLIYELLASKVIVALEPMRPVASQITIIGQGRRLWSRRINGVVTLELPANISLPENGFSCRVNIEWDNNEKRTLSLGNVPCEVMRLCCESMDYYFVWRFHINQAAVINRVA
ncbi:hypothetical protein J5N97_010406 [Dioscorea zingiberensis]|uniref:Uncharacterized protein n=1 Tax=Dioscorea zingiberensis TaxID=325984 RepID=A0A9D5CZ25_9LILI|nr:hypothetical protein J5N97_010406 [Dioscorea zingiberensis]